jgi:hypothetical protein
VSNRRILHPVWNPRSRWPKNRDGRMIRVSCSEEYVHGLELSAPFRYMNTAATPEKQESGGLEESPKAATLLLAVVYGAGLLTTNAFLRQHGISDFSLLKPKSLFTGALVVGSLCLIAYWPVLVLASLIEQGIVPRRTWRARLASAVKVLGPWLVLVAVCWGSAGDRFSSLNNNWFTSGKDLGGILAAATFLYVEACGTAILAIQCGRFYRLATDKLSFVGMSQSWGKFLVFATALVIAFSFYVESFATTLYVVIPQQLGGGHPERLKFSVKSASVAEWKQLGIEFVPGTDITEGLDVIHESDSAFSVLIGYQFNQKKIKDGTETESAETTVTLGKTTINGFAVDFEGLDNALVSHLGHPEFK